MILFLDIVSIFILNMIGFGGLILIFEKIKIKENGFKKEKSGRCCERWWNVGLEWCRRYGRGYRDGD